MNEFLTFDDVQIVPKYSEIISRDNCSTVSKFTKNYFIEVPIIGSPMDSVCGVTMAQTLWREGAVGILHRFASIKEQSSWSKAVWDYIEFERGTLDGDKESLSLKFEHPVIAAAVGATGDYFERTVELLKNHTNVICIDVAHGHHIHVKTALEELSKLKGEFKFDIIAGNVATQEGAQSLEHWGADCIRVGIGGGSVCETRIRTGIGVPQLSAVMECVENLFDQTPIISDGGIKYIGDIPKAICAGATTVMVGSLFSGTDESPGEIHVSGQWPNLNRRKLYRGSASESIKTSKGLSKSHVEGTAKMVPLKGSVVNIVNDMKDGLTSAMSYIGVDNISDMPNAASFIKITQSGMKEALPHLLN